MSKYMPTNYEMDVTNELEVIFTNDEEIKTPEELLIDTIQASFNMGYEDAEQYAKYLRGLAVNEYVKELKETFSKKWMQEEFSK